MLSDDKEERDEWGSSLPLNMTFSGVTNSKDSKLSRGRACPTGFRLGKTALGLFENFSSLSISNS